MKKFLSLLLAALLTCSAAVGLSACKKEENDACTAHVDADDNGKCDTCGVDFEDGVKCDAHKDADDDKKCDICGADFEDGAEEPEVKKLPYSFLVQLDNGTPVVGAVFTVKNGEHEETLTSGADGKVSTELVGGVYEVTFDYETIPSGCIPETDRFEVGSDGAESTLIIRDNNPDGSAEKPFFISEDETALAIEAGAEVHYMYRGAGMRYIRIASADVTVTYKETTYAAEDGTVSVLITPEMGTMTTFSVKNNGQSKLNATMLLVSPEGSMDNPIELTEPSVTVTVPAEKEIYYFCIAEKSGVFVISCDNEKNNLSLTNLTTNAVSSMTAGDAGAYLTVSAGDEIRIAVASTDRENAVELVVNVACYAGSEEEPVPMILSNVELTYAAGASFVFSAEVGQTVTLSDDAATLTFDGQTYTAEDLAENGLTLTGEGETVTFTVTNTSDTNNGILIEVLN